ncbi:MAG: 2-dehydropantoate 2-reductase N-terminal domain-containing protein [Chloroflexota bacterium]
MRFIIYGAGGIGCVIGGHLFRAGYEVVLVGNARHVDAINAHGLNLFTGDAEYTLNIPAVKTAPELSPFRADDVVMLCAKAQHTVKCLGQLRNAGAPRTLPILCAQNSIWNEPTATRVFDNVYGVMIMIPAVFMTPGVVFNPIVRCYGVLEIGRYPRGTDALCEMVAEALQRAGFSSHPHADVMQPKAAKCLLNLGNALDAITDERGDGRAFMDAVRAEALQVWQAAGIAWEPREAFQARMKEHYGDRRAPPGHENLTKRSSTWQSLARGAGSIEAEQINGDVVMLGRQLGIATPHNALLSRIADEMARAGDAPGKYTTEELTTMVKQTRE